MLSVSCPRVVHPLQDSTGNGRFQLACKQCLDGYEVAPGVGIITSDTVPVCKALPIGVSTSSATTLATLELLPGYFRVSAESRNVLECYRKESCAGGTNSFNYCATGYTGPCKRNTDGIISRRPCCSRKLRDDHLLNITNYATCLPFVERHHLLSLTADTPPRWRAISIGQDASQTTRLAFTTWPRQNITPVSFPALSV